MITTVSCAVCGNNDLTIFEKSGLRRGFCSSCHHQQRIDTKTFDYTAFAMGDTGLNDTRLDDQMDFIARHLTVSHKVLELGCATGALAQKLRQKFTFDQYDGIELSPAKRKAELILDRVFDDKLPHLVNDGRIGLNCYDLVITSHCLEHIADLHEEIGAIRPVMSGTGALFIEVPNLSGNLNLPIDDNLAHLHFFSVSSLTRLLALYGLEVTIIQTGAWHDARYPDCIRAIARPVQSAKPEYVKILSDHPALNGVDKVIVWGAGKMAQEVLAHYFDPARILFFVDKDFQKHGSFCLGLPVQPILAISSHPGCCILINSIEYEASIRSDINSEFNNSAGRVIGISELLDQDPCR